MRLGKLYFVLAILMPLLLVGYYFHFISFEAPHPIIKQPDSTALAIAIKEGGTRYNILSPLLLLFGTVGLWALSLSRRTRVKFKKKDIWPISTFSLFFVVTNMLLFGAIISAFEGYKSKQFWNTPQGQTLILNSKGIEIPFALIYGDIMPPIQSGRQKEFMLLTNKPSLFIPWGDIARWEVMQLRGRYTTHIYKLTFSPNSEYSTIGIVKVNRSRFRSDDKKVLEYATRHLNTPPVVHDDILN